MAILTTSYSRHAAATERLNALSAAYNDMPSARKEINDNPSARALIDTASRFQAAMRNKVGNAGISKSAIIREFGDAATTPSLKTNAFIAQLAIASDQPVINLHLNGLLAAHKTYLASQPKTELLTASRRLLGMFKLGQ